MSADDLTRRRTTECPECGSQNVNYYEDEYGAGSECEDCGWWQDDLVDRDQTDSAQKLPEGDAS